MCRNCINGLIRLNTPAKTGLKHFEIFIHEQSDKVRSSLSGLHLHWRYTGGHHSDRSFFRKRFTVINTIHSLSTRGQANHYYLIHNLTLSLSKKSIKSDWIHTAEWSWKILRPHNHSDRYAYNCWKYMCRFCANNLISKGLAEDYSVFRQCLDVNLSAEVVRWTGTISGVENIGRVWFFFNPWSSSQLLLSPGST